MTVTKHNWYVKELSVLTNISVKTLHHYDRIGLLKPSLRQSNGYRSYTEGDVVKLQRILALKLLGFDLKQIKTLMGKEIDFLEHIKAQKTMIDQKIDSLMDVQKVLSVIIQEGEETNSIPLERIINLMEVYHMTKELENSWAEKFLSPEEFKAYIDFETALKVNYSPLEKETFEKSWATLVKEVEARLDQDPTNAEGQSIGKRCMDLVNPLYTRDQSDLKKAIWDKGFKGGAIPEEERASAEVIQWLDKAIGSYYRSRIYIILEGVTSLNPPENVVKLWDEILEEMCGSSEKQRAHLCEAAFADSKISDIAKEWIRKNYGS